MEMNESYSLVIADMDKQIDSVEFENIDAVFLLQNEKQLHIKEANSNVLNFLTYSIARRPKNLLIHVQRIIFCYQYRNEEYLYAALADFFVVLQEAGFVIKQKLLAGASTRLSPLSKQRLESYLHKPQLIVANSYTVLATGMESELNLVNMPAVAKAALDHDPLKIARDFIEYSQLDDAQETLEKAILIAPDYNELHEDLLELYKLTNNIDGFNKMYSTLSDVDHPMHVQWDELNSYFTQ